jgi:two-component system LytT family response regulator
MNDEKKYRVFVVDDEPLGREAVKEVLKAYPQIEVVGEAGDGRIAVREIREQKPDLVFLDVQMPVLTGFDVLDLLGSEAPLVVFVTAYDQYAVEAFEKRAMDYILKPVTPSRMTKTIQRLEETMWDRSQQLSKAESLVDEHNKSQGPLTRVLIQNRGEVTILKVEEIIYIEAKGDYLAFVTAKGRQLKYERMTRIESWLDPKRFCRVHRSYIVAMDTIDRIEPYSKDDRVAILRSGHKIPVSRSGYDLLMERLA